MIERLRNGSETKVIITYMVMDSGPITKGRGAVTN